MNRKEAEIGSGIAQGTFLKNGKEKHQWVSKTYWCSYRHKGNMNDTHYLIRLIMRSIFRK